MSSKAALMRSRSGRGNLRRRFWAFFSIRKTQGISYLLGRAQLDVFAALYLGSASVDLFSLFGSRFIGGTAHHKVELCSLPEPLRSRSKTLLPLVLDGVEELVGQRHFSNSWTYSGGGMPNALTADQKKRRSSR